MQIDHDPQSDALYIRLRDGEVDDTIETAKYVYVDVDKEGIPMGIELLFAGRLLPKENLTSVTFNFGSLVEKPA
jgi:uncharacterized protein YuzE